MNRPSDFTSFSVVQHANVNQKPHRRHGQHARRQRRLEREEQARQTRAKHSSFYEQKSKL